MHTDACPAGAVQHRFCRSGDNAEAIMSGTSMATPHVTGVAALYLQYRPGASPAEVKAALQGECTQLMWSRNAVTQR